MPATEQVAEQIDLQHLRIADQQTLVTIPVDQYCKLYNKLKDAQAEAIQERNRAKSLKLANQQLIAKLNQISEVLGAN